MERPAAVFTDNISRDEKSGARHRAAGTQKHPWEIQEPRLPQKPQGIAGADPVGAVVFGVAVAGDGGEIAAAGSIVHTPHKSAVHQIVRVKDEVACVILLQPRLPQAAEQEIQGVALTHAGRVKPLKHLRTRLAGHSGSGVGAVVRHHKNIQFVRRIILRATKKR